MSNFIEGQLNPDSGIDFSKAQKLPGGGSTCDIYKTVSQRRKVFVKRLKPKFRNMPLYLAAFDKEYDIGISLNHKSLPQYREFHEDYIVMDFIDGKTLADMINEKDLWLSKEENVVRLLRELLDVVDYLHKHNIVHCDIKPDNIMITTVNHNLMLIDLDKCYTDWLDDTSGDPSRYAMLPDKRGDRSIDFHGIGITVEKIIKSFSSLSSKRLEAFKQKCLKDDITIEDLKTLLFERNNIVKIRLMAVAVFLLGVLIAGMIIRRPQTNQEQAETFQTSYSKDTIVIHHESLPADNSNVSKEPHSVRNSNNSLSSNTVPPNYKQEIEEEMQVRFAPMYVLMDKAENLLADSLSTDDNLRQISYDLTVIHSDIMLDSYEYFEKKYANINDFDIQMVVALSKTNKDILKRWDKIQQRITDVIVSHH